MFHEKEILGLTWAQVDLASRLITRTRAKYGCSGTSPNADTLAILSELKSMAVAGATIVFSRGASGWRM